MNTRSLTIAGEDLTGPAALKVQSRPNRSGSLPAATPVRAGQPRNIGQSPLGAAAFAHLAHSSQAHKAMCRAAFANVRDLSARHGIIAQRKGRRKPKAGQEPQKP